MLDNKQVLLVAQRNASDDQPALTTCTRSGLCPTSFCHRAVDGTIKVLVEGSYRAAVLAIDDDEQFAVASVSRLKPTPFPIMTPPLWSKRR